MRMIIKLSLFIVALYGFKNTLWASTNPCLRALLATNGQILKYDKDLAKNIARTMSPQSKNSFVVIDMSPFFSPEAIQRIYKKLMAAHGNEAYGIYFMNYFNHKPTEISKLRKILGKKDIQLFFKFISSNEELVNKAFPEEGPLRSNIISLRWGDGTEEFPYSDEWHIDNTHFTLVIAFMGLSTNILVRKKLKENWRTGDHIKFKSRPRNVFIPNTMEAVFSNGIRRSYYFDEKDITVDPLGHKAPDFNKNHPTPRLFLGQGFTRSRP